MYFYVRSLHLQIIFFFSSYFCVNVWYNDRMFRCCCCWCCYVIFIFFYSFYSFSYQRRLKWNEYNVETKEIKATEIEMRHLLNLLIPKVYLGVWFMLNGYSIFFFLMFFLFFYFVFFFFRKTIFFPFLLSKFTISFVSVSVFPKNSLILNHFLLSFMHAFAIYLWTDHISFFFKYWIGRYMYRYNGT